MKITKKELEEQVNKLADFIDTSVRNIDTQLKNGGVDLSEFKRNINNQLKNGGVDLSELKTKGSQMVQTALPVIREKRNQLEMVLLKKRLGRVDAKILEKLRNGKMREDEAPNDEE